MHFFLAEDALGNADPRAIHDNVKTLERLNCRFDGLLNVLRTGYLRKRSDIQMYMYLACETSVRSPYIGFVKQTLLLVEGRLVILVGQIADHHLGALIKEPGSETKACLNNAQELRAER